MTRPLVLFLVALAAASPAFAQERSPAEAAEQFSLDLPPSEDAEAPSSVPADAPADAPSAAVPDRSRFSADTPIEELIANRRAKRVLDREMPGLSGDKNLDKFRKLSLRQLAPLSGGRVTPDLLARVDSDLAAID